MDRRHLIALCAASAMTSGAAWAQPDKNDRGNGGGNDRGNGNGGGRGEQRGGAPGQGNGRAEGQARGGGGPQAAAPQAQRQTPAAAQPQGQGRAQVAPQGRPGGQGGFQGGGRAAPAPRQGFAAQGGRGGGGGGFVYRGQQHARINGPAFSYPSGWGYRRWGIGQSLPLLFLAAPFFFLDWDSYGFGPPPRGYVWVRYGPDLLLVSRRSGRIRQVIYGVFY